MNGPAYELRGPFLDSLSSSLEEVISHAVKLRAERNSPHPLNPVAQLKRVLSNTTAQDAVLLLGLQFFEIFTVVHNPEEGQVPRDRKSAFRARIKSLAGSHLPKHKSTHEDFEELQSHWQQEVGDSEILKDHVFSCGVAYAQVLKIRSRGNSVTVYYHPNSMKATKLSSKNHMATAMRFTFCLESEEETTRLLTELERRMGRYSHAALMLGEHWVLPSALHIVAVTRPVGGGSSDELLLLKDPPWGSTVSAPASWDLECSDASTPLWVYLLTPLGYGVCEISPYVLSLFRKGHAASFYVGVRHPQVSGTGLLVSTSQLQRLQHSQSSASEEDGLDELSEDDWQPYEDVDESTHLGANARAADGSSLMKPSIGIKRSLQKSSTSTGSSSKSGGSRGRSASGHAVNGRHIRVHCCCNFVEAQGGAAGPKPAGPLDVLSRSLGTSIAGGPWGVAAAAAVALFVAASALCSSWGLLVTLLNVGLAVLHLVRSRRRPTPLVSEAAPSAGRWQVKLVKAEIVANEPWSASGKSVLAEATKGGEDAVEDQTRIFASEFGFTEDTVERFLLAVNHDETLAHQGMRKSYEWRRENDAIDILSQPQPHFKFFKGMFRHGLLGVTREGHPVWFMRIGDMKQGFRSYKESGLGNRDLARHLALCMDYMFTSVESAPLPEGRALWVLDLKGMGFSDISGDAFDMGKQIAGMISANWPERLHRAFIVNVPGFFSILWKLVEHMMAASTRRKIRLLRGKSDMLREMVEEMREEDIPVEYGGKSEGGVYASETERRLWDLVEKLNASPAAGADDGAA